MNEFSVTTSWDDGAPPDLRLADLLLERGIKGTFYIPQFFEGGAVSPSEIRELSSHFEIGAHTLAHVELTTVDLGRARAEITESKDWIEQVTGRECRMFCFPRGKFRREHLRLVSEAGYKGCRTTELLSLRPPTRDLIPVMGTSIQVFPHRIPAYLRNAVKRFNLRNLRRLRPLGSSVSGDWVCLARALLRTVIAEGGVFHPWGHSWEIDAADQWSNLSLLLDFIRDSVPNAQLRTNGELCLNV